jgi:nucleoside 2-deoxyribosyltransferase
MKPRIYLAGPCTGIAELNFPAFNAEAARLRAIGYEVENPAEINPNGGEWLHCMRRDIPRLVLCDAVALLPGWENSRGALIENGLAVGLGIPVRKCAEYQGKQKEQPNPECWFCCEGLEPEENHCPICQELKP